MSAAGGRADEISTITDIGLSSGRRGVPLVRPDRRDAAGTAIGAVECQHDRLARPLPGHDGAASDRRARQGRPGCVSCPRRCLGHPSPRSRCWRPLPGRSAHSSSTGATTPREAAHVAISGSDALGVLRGEDRASAPAAWGRNQRSRFKVSDAERAAKALQGITGKRLTYRRTA